MRLLWRLRRRGVSGEDRVEKVDVGVERLRPSEGSILIESYYVSNPHAKASIYQVPGLGPMYFIEEVELSLEEYEAYDRLMKIMSRELEPPENLDIDPVEYVREQAEQMRESYKRTFKGLSEEGWSRVLYYVIRDLAGYGPIDPLMRDPNIEDISCNGLRKPIYVWHRKYESLPTNLSFIDDRVFNDFIIKLAHKSSRHISSAHPILDATLPEKHRLAATFQREVSTHGSSFCIRKFREDPFSIIDLITLGTLPSKLAAYFWLMLENRMSFIILGGTGAGKTSMLNALLSLIPLNKKIVTVEDVAELNIPHENWVQLISRKGFTFGSSGVESIDLFDLVKLSLRYRPDYIVVGEVRGEEAYTLFQAMATGHGGLCTMHADSLDHAVKRLTSEPMNIAEVYIPLANIAVYVARVDLPKPRGGLKFGRRVRTVWEIADYGDYRVVASWDPKRDDFNLSLEASVKLSQISEMRGLTLEELQLEIERRSRLLEEMARRGIRRQEEVSRVIQEYLRTGNSNLDELMGDVA